VRRTDREVMLSLEEPGAPPYWALLDGAAAPSDV
jgi:hypothetical protein